MTSNFFGDFIEDVTADTNAVLRPEAHWTSRWRASARRQAARRSLRGMMKLYCPDVLEAFEAAVAGRAEWVLADRDHLPLRLSDPDTPVEELQEIVDAMAATLDALLEARSRLGVFIRQTYPLGPLTDRG